MLSRDIDLCYGIMLMVCIKKLGKEDRALCFFVYKYATCVKSHFYLGGMTFFIRLLSSFSLWRGILNFLYNILGVGQAKIDKKV